MTRQTNKAKKKFLIYQTIIILGIFAVVFTIILNGSLRNTKDQIKIDLNNSTNVILDALTKYSEVPDVSNATLTFFIINAISGDYYLERNDFDKKNNILWEKYRTKLTYQMQKQKNGWITYPATNAINISKESKIIRYMTVSERNLIVVTETLMPNDLTLLKGLITRKELFNLLIIFILTIIVLKVMNDSYYLKLKTYLTDNYDSNFDQFNNSMFAGATKKQSSKLNTTQKTNITSPITLQPELSKKPAPTPAKKTTNLDTNLNYKSAQETIVAEKEIIKEEPTPRTPFLQETPKISDPQARKVPEQTKVNLQKTSLVTDAEPSSKLTQIKSPALKKLLQEMRENNQ